MKNAAVAALAVVAAVTLTIMPANAQSLEGLYVRAEAGLAFHPPVVINDVHTGAANCIFCDNEVTGSTATSAIAGGAAGIRMTPSFRAEISVDYLSPARISGRNDLNPPTSLSANPDSVVALANGFIDFPELPVFGPLLPYVDAGIGMAFNSTGAMTGVTSGSTYALASGSAARFAYAVGAGVAYPLAPHLSLDLAYRFFDLGELRSGSSAVQGGSTKQVTGLRSSSADAHTLIIGVRFDL